MINTDRIEHIKRNTVLWLNNDYELYRTMKRLATAKKIGNRAKLVSDVCAKLRTEFDDLSKEEVNTVDGIVYAEIVLTRTELLEVA
jgi:hypothetical protein